MARRIVGPSQARCSELVRERFIILARGPRRTLELPNFGAINATVGQSPPKRLIDPVVCLRSDIELVRFERRVPGRVEHPVAEDVVSRDGAIRLGLDPWHRSVLRARVAWAVGFLMREIAGFSGAFEILEGAGERAVRFERNFL
jgi:hypothetical protein